MNNVFTNTRIQLGACYYPEHWPETLWQDDFRRMNDLGFSVVRMAEFAWSIFEPNEGEFDFTLFDRALDLAHRNGIQVILGTPTATPPAWLTKEYPEVLNMSMAGIQYQHGQRRHYNYNSPVYQELSVRIVKKMALHYKDHPAVVGWQIDNELNCEVNVFYSDSDHRAFREWLKEKYGTLARFNQAWGTVFWNQTYSDWEQVYLTRPTVSDSPNPHQALDEKRFYSDSAISFARLQADIIREIAPNHWITTNGLFGHLDSHKMTETALDFMSYDSYPNFSSIYPDQGEKPLLDRKWSWNLSLTRDISSNFCVMEQQSGPGGWVNRMEQSAPKPGQMRLWTYQSIAHGADMVLYFRWRTAPIGTEIYWHGINDYHNQPNRRVREAEKICREINAIASRVAGSKVHAEVAILRDYDNEWDGELDLWHGPLESQSNTAWFKAFQHNHIPVDVVTLRDNTSAENLGKYQLLVYPHPAIMSDATAKLLEQYVQQGGQLIFGSRTGYKDTDGHCPMQAMPGPVAGLCGVTVEDFTIIHGTEGPSIKWIHKDDDSGKMTADAFNDILHIESPTAEVLALYSDNVYYAEKPVLVRNSVGDGTVYYYGAAFNEPVAERMIEITGVHSPVRELVSVPESVEVSIRHRQAGKFVFLLNYSGSRQTVSFTRPVAELLTDQMLQGQTEIEPYGVMIILSE